MSVECLFSNPPASPSLIVTLSSVVSSTFSKSYLISAWQEGR